MFTTSVSILSTLLSVSGTAPSVESAASTASAAAASTMDWSARLVLTGLQALCALFYGRLFFRAIADGGRVRINRFGPPEAGIAGLLTGLIGLMMVAGFFLHARAQGAGSATPIPTGAEIINTVVNTFMLQLLLVVGLLAGWAARHIPIAETLGLTPAAHVHWSAERPPPATGQAIWTAAGFVLAAYPLLIGAAEFVQKLTGISSLGGGQEEEAIRLFKASAALGPKVAMILAAVVIAPVIEEFVFRGYLYPIFRRYLGAGFGILLNSALFAGIHLHAPSFGPLFVLAVCFTLAYEATGSLLVPIAMHALFNSFNVALLILGVASAGGAGGS